MDYKKIALYAALIVVALILWNAWQREFPATATTSATMTQATQTSNTTASSAQSAVPDLPNAKVKSAMPQAQQTMYSGRLIHVKTDVLDLVIDTHGGNIEQANLLKYPESEQHQAQNIQLFNTSADNFYVAQSGLTGTQGPDTQKGQAEYSAEKLNYNLASGKDTLMVPLVYQGKDGVKFVKTFIFHRNSYTIDMDYSIHNQGRAAWSGYLYTQLARKQPEHHGSLLSHYASFTGAAISSPAEHYQKLKFNNFADEPINQTITGGWAAMIQQYFLSAWVPPANQAYHYYTKVDDNGVYTVGMIGSALTVQPAQTLNTQNKLYVGPAIASKLNALAPHLSMTIDYGWLWFISKIIFWLMKLIDNVVGNWGWSIILTTIVIKIIFYPLSDKSFRSMANMRKLQPRMLQLKERFAGDRAGLSKATMELYRKEKINPLSGCLPIVIQIPVFIALYWVIIQSVELRLAPWLFWVKDLSVHDPYYILPVVMGLLMFVQQKMSPPPPDPTQAKVMMFMPVIFTVFFLQFPAGLVLYWITNTLFTIGHQFFVYKRVEHDDKKKKQIAAHKK
jgi:YidC/Oxa1 family membrane protein insertase